MDMDSVLFYVMFIFSTFSSILANTDHSSSNNDIRHVRDKKTRLIPQQSLWLRADDLTKQRCHKSTECSKLPVDCLACNFNNSCVYGEDVATSCRVRKGINCQEYQFNVTYKCMYCYQLPSQMYTCLQNDTCRMGSRFRTQCIVKEEVACLGKRLFYKLVDCNYSSGVKWSTALLLSITLGGFGVDRFFLGNWQEGIGKLFSFGGLGVWTLLDILLIATGYLKPGDSRYS